MRISSHNCQSVFDTQSRNPYIVFRNWSACFGKVMFEFGETLAGRLADIKNTHMGMIQKRCELRLIFGAFCSLLKAIAKLTENNYRHKNLISRSNYFAPSSICPPIRIGIGIQDDSHSQSAGLTCFNSSRCDSHPSPKSESPAKRSRPLVRSAEEIPSPFSNTSRKIVFIATPRDFARRFASSTQRGLIFLTVI